MLVLTLETTCDETAAAVVDGERNVLSSAIASQDALHLRFKGVVPEIAARAHLERILPVIQQALESANVKLSDLHAVAVTNTPGLAGSLLVGLAAAKALAVALDIPLVTVNHLHAHLYACALAEGPGVFPCAGLVASGGHSNLYDCRSPLEIIPLGGTIDDAAGEAFDKFSAQLGLGYPGGPAIEKAAAGGNSRAYDFPRAFIRETDRLQFSFSGLKTAARYQLADITENRQTPTPRQIADLAASFQEAVVESLVAKCRAALQRTGQPTLCVGGGVAANRRFREALAEMAATQRARLVIAPKNLCTDNAVMAALACEYLKAGIMAPLDVDITAGLERPNRQ